MMFERPITEDDVKYIAKGLLQDFKELPGFKDAELAGISPVYGLDSKTVEYYEVKFSSPEAQDNGYAMVSATTKDFPVVEFSERGLTHLERFRGRLGHSDFKVVRYGPGYVTAEDTRGKLLGEIGHRPVLVPEELRQHIRHEQKSAVGQLVVTEPPGPVLQRKGKKFRRIAYKTFKERYRRPERSAAKLEAAWTKALKPRGNPGCVYDYYWAGGTANHAYYLQIPKNTAPNNNDHASGCGPTAWLNLCAWHDLNWTGGMMPGARRYNDAYINDLTMACHDYIGTYEPWWTFDADQGFTWPEDMPKGYNFLRRHFHHACSYWYRYDWWNTDEEWVFAVARDVIRAGKPFIVGYFDDWHYAIGYGVAECRSHGWEDHSWIKIYPAWSANDSQDKWITKNTIFGIYGVYEFFPLLQFGWLENPQQLEVAVSGPGGANRLFVYTGTAVFHSHGAVGSDWMWDTIFFDVGRTFTSAQFRGATAMASLASIANAETAVNAGWAIDRVSAGLTAAGKVRVTLDYAIRDVDGYLYRVGYKVNVLAQC